MFTKFCLNKFHLMALIVLISSCLRLTQQKSVPQYINDYNPFNNFEPFTASFQQFLIVQQHQRQKQQQQQQQRVLPAQQLQRPSSSQPNQNSNRGSSLINEKWLNPGQDLIFATTTAAPTTDAVVFVNNQPAIATMVPFIPAATTPTPQFLDCFGRCRTTAEFNPICASNREQYGNEQKFNCARRCGADIKIVRRGSCQGLFPMSRG